MVRTSATRVQHTKEHLPAAKRKYDRTIERERDSERVIQKFHVQKYFDIVQSTLLDTNKYALYAHHNSVHICLLV
jgi:hypothetical protein